MKRGGSRRNLGRKLGRMMAKTPWLSVGGLYALGSFPLGLWPWPAEPPPRNQENICAIFREKEGVFGGWYEDAKAASGKYGVPVATIMAFIKEESSFDARARPPWEYAPKLGWIPWWTRGTDYGYGQFIDSTWNWYRLRSGNWMARRDNFANVADAIGIYTGNIHKRTGVSMKDAYRMYIAYNAGPDSMRSGAYPHRSARAAKSVARRAARYESQLKRCRGELESGWTERFAHRTGNRANQVWRLAVEAFR